MRFGVFLAAGWLALSALGCDRALGAVLDDAAAALAQGHYRDAQMRAGDALARPGLDPLTQSRLRVIRGLARQAQGQSEDAMADFTQALSANVLPAAERASALFDRGVVLDTLGHLDDAVGDYSAALQLAPDAANARNNRANVYRRQGRLDEARGDYLLALSQDAGHAQYPYYGLGQVAEAQGDTAQAREYYEKALAAAPGFALAAARLETLGGAQAPAESGMIVLRPPPPAAAPIVLRPPPAKAMDRTAAEPVALHLSRPAAGPSSAQRAHARRPGQAPQQDPLRPAIIESPGKAAAHSGRPLVQLGAWRSEGEARTGWDQVQKKAGGLLDGLSPHIVAADLPGRGRYYRLQVVPTQPPAQFCAALTAKGMGCFPIRR